MNDLRDRLRAATELATDPPDRLASVRRRADRLRARRRVLVAAGAAGGVAVAGAVAFAVLPAPAPRDVPPADPATASPPSPSPSATRPAPTGSALPRLSPLDARYQACAVARGFDPGGVQVVFRDGEAAPAHVKTGRDVPAAVHRPCFVAIGGADPHASSHGNPAP